MKFEGHYHGWFDNILWSTAPGRPGRERRRSPCRQRGQDSQRRRRTSTCCRGTTWSRCEERLARGDVAAVIMEAAMCNAGRDPARAGLPRRRARGLHANTATLLIFDEVITGFRLGPGGAQERLGVTPDLATFAKAIANGFPVAAVAGRADLMDLCAQGRGAWRHLQRPAGRDGGDASPP